MTAFQIELNLSKNLKVLKSSNGYFSSHRHKANAHAKYSLQNGRKKGLLNHQGHVKKLVMLFPSSQLSFYLKQVSIKPTLPVYFQ